MMNIKNPLLRSSLLFSYSLGMTHPYTFLHSGIPSFHSKLSPTYQNTSLSVFEGLTTHNSLNTLAQRVFLLYLGPSPSSAEPAALEDLCGSRGPPSYPQETLLIGREILASFSISELSFSLNSYALCLHVISHF